MHRRLVRGRAPMRAIFTPRKTLSKNNRYYAIVDRYSNITAVKHCYHANLYLNSEPWLHKRVYQTSLNYLCTYCNYCNCSYIYKNSVWQSIGKLLYRTTVRVSNVCAKLAPTGADRPANKRTISLISPLHFLHVREITWPFTYEESPFLRRVINKSNPPMTI